MANFLVCSLISIEYKYKKRKIMIESNQTKQLTLMELSNINGGNFPYGWYSPFHIISDNILCRNSYSYNKTNPDNDKLIID